MLFSNFYVFGSTWYLSIYLAECSHYTRSISLLPPQREYYFQVSPRKIFEIFPFSPVSQAIPTDVLRQGVKMLPLTKKELKSHQDATKCYICGKRFLKNFASDKNCRKVTDNCHFTGRYRGTAHSMCI